MKPSRMSKYPCHARYCTRRTPDASTVGLGEIRREPIGINLDTDKRSRLSFMKRNGITELFYSVASTIPRSLWDSHRVCPSRLDHFQPAR